MPSRARSNHAAKNSSDRLDSFRLIPMRQLRQSVGSSTTISLYTRSNDVTNWSSTSSAASQPQVGGKVVPGKAIRSTTETPSSSVKSPEAADKGSESTIHLNGSVASSNGSSTHHSPMGNGWFAGTNANKEKPPSGSLPRKTIGSNSVAPSSVPNANATKSDTDGSQTSLNSGNRKQQNGVRTNGESGSPVLNGNAHRDHLSHNESLSHSASKHYDSAERARPVPGHTVRQSSVTMQNGSAPRSSDESELTESDGDGKNGDERSSTGSDENSDNIDEPIRGGGNGGGGGGARMYRSRLRASVRRELALAGRCGLRNLGNTCFMNSVIQCLSNTRPLLEYVLDQAYRKDLELAGSKRKSGFITTYASMMVALWSRKSSIAEAFSPVEFKRQVERLNRQFTGSSQHDAQELLRYVLQGLHEDINRVPERPPRDAKTIKNFELDYERAPTDDQKADVAWSFYHRFENSAVVDMFVGQLKSTLEFTDCAHKSVTFDPFWDLSLPIPRNATTSSIVSLDECMHAFVAHEALDSDERPKCERCNQRRRCTKSLSIHRFPRILVIHLKRFSGEHWRSSKVNTQVNFPVSSFDMTPYAASPRPPGEKGRRYVYKLYAIANHSGSMEFGHYVANCRQPFITDSSEWNCFDDSRVSQVDATRNSLVNSQAYVLFYELEPPYHELDGDDEKHGQRGNDSD